MSTLHFLNAARLVIVAVGAVGTLLLITSFFFTRPGAQTDGSHFSIAKGRLYFGAVWVVYCSLAFLLAGWNVTYHREPKDLTLAFALLALAAWLGFWFALVGSPYLRPRSVYRHIGLLVLSFTALLFSTFIWLFFAVNIYGA